MQDPILISALQHYLFCPRQYALIHVEQVWAENRFTAEGQVMHQKAHEGKGESRPGVRITRGLKVGSEEWGLSGVCDVVEFHGHKSNYEKVIPVEYKRGKPKAHRADEIQLCSQAVCLEEMLKQPVPIGFLFYGKTRRRIEVAVDDELRSLLKTCIEAIHAIRDAQLTPTAHYERSKCEACSLVEICRPKASESSVNRWFEAHLIHEARTD